MKLIPCVPKKFIRSTAIKAAFDYKNLPYGFEFCTGYDTEAICNWYAVSWIAFVMDHNKRILTQVEYANFVRWREENATYLDACT